MGIERDIIDVRSNPTRLRWSKPKFEASPKEHIVVGAKVKHKAWSGLHEVVGFSKIGRVYLKDIKYGHPRSFPVAPESLRVVSNP